MRPEPDVQPALRHAADRARDRRPRRHRGRTTTSATASGTGFVLDDLNPGSLVDTIGWARRHLVPASRAHRRACAVARWRRTSRGTAPRASTRRLYREAYARRRGHPYPRLTPRRRGIAPVPPPRKAIRTGSRSRVDERDRGFRRQRAEGHRLGQVEVHLPRRGWRSRSRGRVRR